MLSTSVSRLQAHPQSTLALDEPNAGPIGRLQSQEALNSPSRQKTSGKPYAERDGSCQRIIWGGFDREIGFSVVQANSLTTELP